MENAKLIHPTKFTKQYKIESKNTFNLQHEEIESYPVDKQFLDIFDFVILCHKIQTFAKYYIH